MRKEHFDEQENLWTDLPGEKAGKNTEKWGGLPRFLGYIVLTY